MPALAIACAEHATRVKFSSNRLTSLNLFQTVATLGYLAARCIVLSEKDAKLAQKLDQLQSFIVVFPQECMGQLAYFGPT